MKESSSTVLRAGGAPLLATALGLILLVSPVTVQPQSQPAPNAQSQSAADQKSGRSPLRVTTRLVQIDVVAHTKKGEPVTDLKREDFLLTDGGHQETISVFVPPSGPPAPAASKPLLPNTFTNRAAGRAELPNNATIILLDAVNTEFNDQAFAREEIVGFLKQLQPGDRVAIYLLARQLEILHDFTSDAAPLLRALQRVEGYVSPQLEAGNAQAQDELDLGSTPDGMGAEQDASRLMNEFLQSARQRIADFNNTNRVRLTLDCLEAIAEHVAPVKGRKNLIWVSASFPFSIGLLPSEAASTALYPSQERRTFADAIIQTTRALNRADVAIYPVDARGLIGAFSRNPRFNMVPGTRPKETGGLASNALAVGKLGPAGQNPNDVKADATTTYFASMDLLADRTGGRAFYNTNDIRGAVRQAIDDSHASYLLGYYPTHGKWDGSFRDVRLKVARSGMEIRYRRGYVAVPDSTPGKAERMAELRSAAESPIEATALGITVAVSSAGLDPARSLRLKLELNPAELQLNEMGSDRVGGIDILVVQNDGQGKPLDTFATTQSLDFPQDLYAQALKFGLTLNVDLTRKPETSRVHLVVRDVISGATGSLQIPLSALEAAQ